VKTAVRNLFFGPFGARSVASNDMVGILRTIKQNKVYYESNDICSGAWHTPCPVDQHNAKGNGANQWETYDSAPN
jgi:hypothetical protein